MDPDAALAIIIDAAVAGDRVALLEASENLAEWLGFNGFAPKDPRTTEEES